MPPPISRSLSILYVDEEPALLEIGRTFLEMEDTFRVTTCRTAKEALDLHFREPFDAILSDYQMPGMNGIDFLQQLRGASDQTPFIMLTGKSREEIAILALNTGADFYYQKGGDPIAQFAELTNAIKNAVGRRRYEAEIQRRLAFERLVSIISSRFVACKDVDLPINQALEEIGSFSGASRAYIFLINKNGLSMDNTHEWCADGVSPQIDTLQDLPCSLFPWWMEKLWKNEIIHIRDVGEMPVKAAAEQMLLEAQGVRSLIVIPITIQQDLAGFIGFDDIELIKEWDEEDKKILRFCGDIIGSALQRKRSEDALRRSEEIERSRNHILTLIGMRAGLGEILESICMHGETLDPAIRASVLLYDSESEKLFHGAAPGIPDDYNDLLRAGLPIGPDIGSCGSAAYHREMVIAFDIENDPRWTPNPAFVEKTRLHGMKACWSAPILSSQDDLLGTIAHYCDHISEPGEENLQILNWSARLSALAIEQDKEAKKLRDSEEKFRSLVEHAMEGIAILDFEGTILFANSSAAYLLEIEGLESLIGRNVVEFIAPGSREDAIRDLMNVSEGRDAYVAEYTVISDKGKKIFVDCVGKLIHYGGIKADLISVRDVTERKKAEDALKESEEKYRIIAENTADCIWIYDTHYTLQYISPSVERIKGFTVFESMKRTIDEVMTPESHAVFLDVMREQSELERSGKCDPNRSFTFESEEYCRDGSTIIVETLARYLRDEEGCPVAILGISRDITGRKQAETELQQKNAALKAADEKLKAAHQRLLTVLDGINAVVYVADMETGDLLFLNQHGQQMAGLEMGSEGRKCWETIQTGQTGPCDFCTNWRLVDAEGNPTGVYQWEFQNTANGRWYDCRDSAIRWIDGRIVRLEIATDITERKRAEEMALRESEERYRDLFEAMHDGHATLQITAGSAGIPLDAYFLEANPAFEKITGLSPDHVIGRRLADVLPEIEPVWKQCYTCAALTGEPQFFEHDLAPRDQSFEITVYIPRDSECTLLFHDITEKKKRDAETKRSLMEKEILLKEIHHRVKNNMQVISGLLMLQRKKFQDPAIREVFLESESRVFSIALVHEKLYQSKNLSRIEYGRYLAKMCDYVLSSRESRSDAVSLDIEADGIFLSIDRAVPLSLITNELLTNSLKYAFPDGRKGQIRISMERDGDRMIYIFSDNGVGFPEDIDFRNTQSLGMQLVNNLVMQLMGTLSMTQGEGTNFMITFPYQDQFGDDV